MIDKQYALRIFVTMIGIYKITSPTKKVYIGQSIDIEKRIKAYSKNRCKGQILLYNSLKKYGWKKHIFEIVRECEVSELNDLERYYQDLFSCIGKNGLNLKLTKTNDRSGAFSELVKNKISQSKFKNNAIKKGKYKDGMTFTKKVRLPRKKNILYIVTGECFYSVSELYRKYKDNFYSYSSLMYDIRHKRKTHKYKKI